MAGLLFRGARVCAAAGDWAPGWLLTAGATVAGLGPGDPPAGAGDGPGVRIVDAGGHVLLPGFVDLHVHGGAGGETMDGEADGLARMARFHAAHGTTAIVPTTWAAPEADLHRALEAVAAAAGPVPGGATILGAHLEGPWLNPARAGAQDPAGIRPPDRAEARRLLDGGVVRVVTLAPELDAADGVIAECRERGVVVSAGHTEATYEQMAAAVAAGVTQVTHTFNAMGRFGHRDPGTAGAALAFRELRCEVIADGVHVHPGALAVLGRAKGPGGVLLVTDATRAAGLPEGPVVLGGRPAHHREGAVRLPDGRLAGSALTLDVAVRRFAAATGWGWGELWRAAAANAADALGLPAKGRLAAGADADLVLLDAAGDVRLTVVAGTAVAGPGPRLPREVG